MRSDVRHCFADRVAGFEERRADSFPRAFARVEASQGLPGSGGEQLGRCASCSPQLLDRGANRGRNVETIRIPTLVDARDRLGHTKSDRRDKSDDHVHRHVLGPKHSQDRARSEHTRGDQRVDELHGVLSRSKRLSVVVRKSMTHNSDHLRTIPAVARGEVGNEAVRPVRRVDREVGQRSRNERIGRILRRVDGRTQRTLSQHTVHRRPCLPSTARTRRHHGRDAIVDHALQRSLVTRSRHRHPRERGADHSGLTRHLDGTSDFGKALMQRMSGGLLALRERVGGAFVHEPVVGATSGRLESPHRSLAGSRRPPDTSAR